MSKPAEPRDAATVVVLRDAAQGMQVYLVKRSRAVDFMAGAHVFPGGRLDPADRSLAACAVRETFEEAGLALEAAALVPWVRWIGWTSLLWATLPLPGAMDSELVNRQG